MGKKGSWFSALKRAFTSKDNVIDGSEKQYIKDKKRWGLGKSKHGEINSFIPLHREPSSIEKILEDAEREQHNKIHQETNSKKIQKFKAPLHQPRKQVQQFKEPYQEPPKKVQQSKASKSKPNIVLNKRDITPNSAQISAIKIQAAYRGYMDRKNFRALKGLVRLQRVMKGQSVKRQATNTMRCMQLLVRVQSQIRTRRLQMIESRNLQQNHQTPQRSEREYESSFSKWSLTPQSEAEADEEWDDSVLTTEEKDARMRRKVEAVIKSERALAYTYSQFPIR